ncbi:MAG: hypothetical protein KatS3mg033_0804 [Thermonema sp.]|uniref:hypothetical protein n=1 Tax=Thermonema sp. TaxID=2231181 RepID=UPI0021DD9186|nr:hypothetical protein [Thermonema sp.]GIV39004.1 MAG: hypothetical protein KatS3mg033_0804 [Thermonema sp.]
MKKLLFITFILLTFFKVKAQQDSIPFLLPDYIAETDTFHVYHWELDHRFEEHLDIAFPPFYISYKGGPFAVMSMAICTMTHKPYFLMFIPFQTLPDRRIMLFFADAGGNVKGLFETDRRITAETKYISVCYSESIKELIF